MSDYDELVKALRGCAEVNTISFYKRGLMRQSADAIEELSSILDESRHNYGLAEEDVERLEELVPSWISVEKEGLPEKSGERIVFLRCGDDLLDPQLDDDLSYVTSMHYDADNCIWDDGTCRYNGILDAVNKPHTYYVTHWMPLPEPPKEEGE